MSDRAAHYDTMLLTLALIEAMHYRRNDDVASLLHSVDSIREMIVLLIDVLRFGTAAAEMAALAASVEFDEVVASLRASLLELREGDDE